MKENAPPLYVWVIAASFFLLCQSLLFLYSEQLFPIYGNLNKGNATWIHKAVSQNEVNKKVYLENQSTYPDAYHIVAIGSSLTRQNIDCQDDFLQSCREQYDTTLIISKFASAARPLEAMSEIGGMFDLFHQHRPDLILIEQDLVSFDFLKTRFLGNNPKERIKLPPLNSNPLHHLNALQHAARVIWFQNRLNLIAFVQTQNQEDVAPYTTKPCNNWRSKTAFEDTFSIPDKPLYPYSFERTAYCHDDLQQLKAAGTEIVIVHHPRPIPLEQKYREDSAQIQIRKTIQQFQDSLGISYWHCPLEMPCAYFRDWGHMAHKGRKVFSDWLMEKIYHEVIQPSTPNSSTSTSNKLHQQSF